MPMVTVQMLSGRSAAQKKDLAESLARETARAVGCPLEAVTVAIHEAPAENWAVSGVYGPDYVAARAKK